MKKLWHALRDQWREDFHLPQFVAVAVVLAACVYVNYRFDFEDQFLEPLPPLTKWLAYAIFYASAYYGTLLTYTVFRKQSHFWRQRTFWGRSALALTVLSLDSSRPYLTELIQYAFAPELHYWGYKVVVNLISFFTIILPVYIFYRWRERTDNTFYGLHPKGFDARPYLIMLLIMTPLILAAAQTPGFLRQYPMYKTNSAAAYLGVPEWVPAMTYELAYGADFITVEFLFRGFFVLGLMSILGRSAILPVAVAYCFLHFGKPAGEAISSLFGGYILATIAYSTRSVWGGVMVHVGIAWGMELVAFVAKL